MLLELGLDEREGQRGADERDVVAQAQEVGDGADVVLVAVREDDRLDVVEPVLDVLEVREDQVDAGVVVVGEEHAAVDDEQLAAVLDDGHVPADLTEAAEGDDADAAVLQGAGQLELGVRVAHRVGSVRGRPGARRGAPAGSRPGAAGRSADSMTPSSTSAALAMIAPCDGDMIASTTGTSAAWMRRGLGEVAAVDGLDHRAVVRPGDVADDGTVPMAPMASSGRVRASSPLNTQEVGGRERLGRCRRGRPWRP